MRLYEINTRAHCRNFGEISDSELAELSRLGFDAVWLMGVWQISDGARKISKITSPDFEGSPYAVPAYEVNRELGGKAQFARLVKRARAVGLSVIVDFVSNHMALDSPWISRRPDWFVRSDPKVRNQSTNEFFLHKSGEAIAFGRDPYFPPWNDTAQLDYSSQALRARMIEVLKRISRYADGVRCDMAMLLLNNIFERTWGARVGMHPPEEYWSEVISAVRLQHPNVLLVAEVYWDLEWDLQQLGFDYCYDKRFYDRLEYDNAESVRQHLTAKLDYQDKLVRFIENHDEPRAAATFSPEKERAAAVTMMTLPGAKLLYEGQCEGRRVRPPVFLARRPVEPIDEDLRAFYEKLLAAVKDSGLPESEWQSCERMGWPDNSSYLNLVAWCWSQDEVRYVVIVNLSEYPSQARVQLPWNDLAGRAWQLKDVLSGALFERDGSELQLQGLYVDLPAWRFHFLCFQ